MAAPSPITNPSRSASKGRLARSGSSLRVLSAFMLAKPERPIGRIEASAPPQMKPSASPNLMMRQASPMLWLEVAQAVTMTMLGPVSPNSMEMMPLAMLEIIIGIVNGETRLGPLFR